MEKFIGVDIGGSHITAAQLSFGKKGFQIEDTARETVNAKGSKDVILKKWTRAITHFTLDIDPALVKIGIAMPGPFDYKEGICLIKGLNKYESLYGLNIRNFLSEHTGISTANILFRNDAESFLHGEIVYNDISLRTKTIGVTLGTGLGAAVSIKGDTRDVFRAVDPMYDGIAEEYISTRWFQKRYKELTGNELPNVKTLLTKEKAIQNQLFKEFGQNFGLFLHRFATEEDAACIIIGGNIARCLEYFKTEMLTHLDLHNVDIRQSTLWEDAALIGAACRYPEAENLLIKTRRNDT